MASQLGSLSFEFTVDVDAGDVGCWIPAFAGMTEEGEVHASRVAQPLFVIPAKAGIHQDGGVREDFSPTVYLLASGYNGTLYVGVTSNLMARIHQHREGTLPGFTRDHGARRLVWFEAAPDDGGGHPAREAHQEVEPRVEDQADCRGQPGMARSGGRLGV